MQDSVKQLPLKDPPGKDDRLELIKFDNHPILNKFEFEKAVKEYNFLRAKSKESNKHLTDTVAAIKLMADNELQEIDGKAEKIFSKISQYAEENISLFVDGNSPGEKILRLYDCEITIITKHKLKIKEKLNAG